MPDKFSFRKISPLSTVRWQEGQHVLDPVDIAEMTRGRIRITSTHRIIIRDAQVTDTGIYRLANLCQATIFLKVEVIHRFKTKISDDVFTIVRGQDYPVHITRV